MSAQPELDLLILGNINVDLILGPLSDWPQEGTERLVEGLEWRVGGNAGNAALACAALGTSFKAISTVGEDLAGQWLRSQFEGSPFRAAQVQWLDTTEPTSITVAAAHPNGERTFLTHLGHLKTLSWATLQPHAPHSQIALLAGAFLTPTLRDEYPQILAYLQGQGTQVALDFGWPDEGFIPAIRQEVGGWLPQVQHLLINDLEAQHLTGLNRSEEALTALAAQLHPQGTVVIKRGAGGVLAQRGGQRYIQAAPAVTVLDSVGAGDTWNAAYLHALLRGDPLKDALHYAVQVASTAISTSPRQYLG